MKHHLVNFYKFISIANIDALGLELLTAAQQKKLLGKIILAPEGINAALSGDIDHLEKFVDQVKTFPEFFDIQAKWSCGETRPFKRMLLKIKNSIVTFTPSDDPKPDEIHAAPRLTPQEWHEWITNHKEEVILVDTRNDYECDWGTFKNSELLPIKKFSEFPEEFSARFADQKDKKFLIFCTGGIRCEKAAPWMIQRGFNNVYQLEGGILKYLEEYSEGQFEGSCFVFDQRWALSEKLQETNEHLNSKVKQDKPAISTTANI